MAQKSRRATHADDFPEDVLFAMAAHFRIVPHIVVFRAVCKAWEAAICKKTLARKQRGRMERIIVCGLWPLRSSSIHPELWHIPLSLKLTHAMKVMDAYVATFQPNECTALPRRLAWMADVAFDRLERTGEKLMGLVKKTMATSSWNTLTMKVVLDVAVKAFDKTSDEQFGKEFKNARRMDIKRMVQVVLKEHKGRQALAAA